MLSANNSNECSPTSRNCSSISEQSTLRGVFSRCAQGMLTTILRERETSEDRLPQLLSDILEEAVKQFPRWITQVAIISHLSSQYRNDVHSYLARIVGDAQTADDLTQDTFINAMVAIRKGGHAPPVFKTKAWLFMIGTNLVRDAVRKSKARHECPLEDVNETALVAKNPRIDALLDLREALHKVKNLCGSKAVEIAKLVQDGCNKEEIAARQQVSTRTVERRLCTLASALRHFS